jgi:hypothetical protein
MLYQLTVTLVGTEPPIWRRLLVPANTPLNIFHRVIQVAMGWSDYHAHQFLAAGKQGRRIYGVIRDGEDVRLGLRVLDENTFCLSDLLHAEKDQCLYEYDFGDSWLHELALERIIAAPASSEKLCCLEGNGACPPEDSGGVPEYEEWLKALKDSEHRDHEDAVDWLGADYDPSRFDCQKVNQLLSVLSLNLGARGR